MTMVQLEVDVLYQQHTQVLLVQKQLEDLLMEAAEEAADR